MTAGVNSPTRIHEYLVNFIHTMFTSNTKYQTQLGQACSRSSFRSWSEDGYPLGGRAWPIGICRRSKRGVGP